MKTQLFLVDFICVWDQLSQSYGHEFRLDVKIVADKFLKKNGIMTKRLLNLRIVYNQPIWNRIERMWLNFPPYRIPCWLSKDTGSLGFFFSSFSFRGQTDQSLEIKTKLIYGFEGQAFQATSTAWARENVPRMSQSNFCTNGSHW